MRSYVFEGVVTALSSISHNGGQSLGITSKLRREKFIQPDGTAEEVPVVSGNGMRGMLRDRGMHHMCRSLGYGEPDENNVPHGLSMPAFYFLFTGGALTSKGNSIDIEYARKLRETIPLVGIWGGAVGNTILPGKLKMGKVIPICAETVHLLPKDERFQPSNPVSIWEYLQEEMYTRKDDERNEKLRGMIAGAREPKQLPGFAATAAVAVKEADAPPQQMMYFVETFAAGTRFHWKIVLDDVTDIEFEAFLTALSEFSRMPYIGGKSNVGLGEVSVDFGKWVQIDSRAVTNSEEVALPLGANYVSHLQSRGNDIREFLASMK